MRGISSYFAYNGCWSSIVLREGDNTGKRNCWDVSYVGDYYNDRVTWMRVSRPTVEC